MMIAYTSSEFHRFSLSDENNNNSYSNLEANETVFSQYPPALLDFAAICCIVFAVVGVVGNILTIAALVSSSKLRNNATTIFIVNLCVADLLFCGFSLPLSAATFFERQWRYGDVLCRLFPLLRYSNGAVSIFSVIAITFNRYVLIVHTNSYEKIYKPVNIVIMIVLLWISAFLLFSLPLFEVWGRFGYDPAVGTCSIVQLNGKSPKMYLYAVAFALPSIIYIICYMRIYFVVRKSSKKFQKDTPSPAAKNISFGSSRWILSRRFRYRNGSDGVLDIDNIERSTYSGFNSTQKRDKTELHVLRVMLVVFITFVLCYFPVSLVKIFQKEETWPFLNIFGYLTVYFSNCINPVIYVVISKEYRKAYANLFVCCSKAKNNSGTRRKPTNLMDVPADSFKYIEVCLPKL